MKSAHKTLKLTRRQLRDCAEACLRSVDNLDTWLLVARSFRLCEETLTLVESRMMKKSSKN